VLFGVVLLLVVEAIAAGAVLLTADEGGGYVDVFLDTFLDACNALGVVEVARVCVCL
jgi:hypothetical protein